MWGERSQQYAACREVAETYLRVRDADPRGDVELDVDLEEMMGRMGMLRVGDGDGDGDGKGGGGRGG